MRCAYCKTEISPANNSREHLIINAIGGRREVSGLFCRPCNSTAGYTWDAALAKQLNPLSLFFQIERDRGSPPSQIFPLVQGGAIKVTSEGLQPSKPTIETKRDGNVTTISVIARSRSEARQALEGLRKRHPEIDVEEHLTRAQSQSSYLNDMIKIEMSIGGADAGRSIVKSAFALAVSSGISAAACEEAIRYLQTGERPCFGYYYDRDLLQGRPESAILHCVAVQAKDPKLLLGYVEFFSVYRMIVCLSHDYEGPPIDACYAINPMTGAEVEVKANIDIPREQLDAIYAYECIPEGSMEEVFGKAIPIGIQASIETEMKKVVAAAVEYAWQHCGIRENEPMTTAQVRTMSSMATERLLPFFEHLARNGFLKRPE